MESWLQMAPFLFFHADEWSRGVGEPGRAEKCLFNAGLLLLSVPHKRYGGVMEGQCCSASEPTAELATARRNEDCVKKKINKYKIKAAQIEPRGRAVLFGNPGDQQPPTRNNNKHNLGFSQNRSQQTMTSLFQSPGNVLFVADVKPAAPFESPTVGLLSWCNLFAPSRGTEVVWKKRFYCDAAALF